jgi:hypothetical protein
MQPMPGCESKQLHQGFGFAQPPVLFDWLAADANGETTKQTDMNVRDRRGLPHRRIFPLRKGK